MRKIWAVTLFLLIFSAACQPSEDDVRTAIHQTQAEWTLVPTQTSYPTYTPFLTLSSVPPSSPTPPPASNEMVTIPSGEFLMGCDPWDSRAPCLDGESPSHTVYLDVYAIDLTEVSNAQYAQCVAHEACRPPDFGDADLQSAKYDTPEFDNYPVTNVDWYDARDYCIWVGKRLPSEAEWEKAARGDQDERFYPWGDIAPDCSLVNFIGLNGDCQDATTPVEDYPNGASPYGLLNMAGNVREWVADWYDANFYFSEPPDNPQGPESGWEKVLRGGSYNSDWVDIRVNRRSHNPPTFREADVGFRCARNS